MQRYPCISRVPAVDSRVCSDRREWTLLRHASMGPDATGRRAVGWRCSRLFYGVTGGSISHAVFAAVGPHVWCVRGSAGNGANTR
jgi:hypothetical protein